MSFTRRTSIKKQKTYAWCNKAKASTLHTNSNQIQAQGQGACSVLFRRRGMDERKKGPERETSATKRRLYCPCL